MIQIQGLENEDDRYNLKPEIQAFRLYIEQTFSSRPEHINVRLDILVKVCKIVNTIKDQVELFKEFTA